MTETSLVTAVTVGLVLGVLARWLVPASRGVPFWLTPAVGLGAAMLGTVSARLAGVNTAQVSRVELILQVVLAGLGIAAVTVTADRQPPKNRRGRADRYGKAGRPR
ncbi:GlsB/YeaQ/YmgE family stress response membrane protein [Solwaraspora sp. WMMD1047]|uniref:GlsB/YeaQ/YmgE family stress response membrane protein n=1 Tax=Solwaraspora sp. WMMD1047 TaxID=3016102 RepID=UPI002416FD38|nr:GlsB/YeaQ/YmgE family stress response membrane protein [Solwaraspora sp. WMMD1047]MDG4831729.1 GlsB/YeaQ/YmgE family stress response membrane protein [Solwaraspora sp. WMMD1047]